MWFIYLLGGIMADLYAVIMAIIGLIFLIISLIQKSNMQNSVKNSRSYNEQRGYCPKGFEQGIGCVPNCPLYKHCWGDKKQDNDWCDSDHETFSVSSFFSQPVSIPSSASEDGDWRTVWQDDQRYDDRYEDERNDSDRYNNGGW